VFLVEKSFDMSIFKTLLVGAFGSCIEEDVQHESMVENFVGN
jgi:hypothetical protein